MSSGIDVNTVHFYKRASAPRSGILWFTRYLNAQSFFIARFWLAHNPALPKNRNNLRLFDTACIGSQTLTSAREDFGFCGGWIKNWEHFTPTGKPATAKNRTTIIARRELFEQKLIGLKLISYYLSIHKIYEIDFMNTGCLSQNRGVLGLIKAYFFIRSAAANSKTSLNQT